MSKLPAIQFYPADWRKDPGIQALEYEDRGIWFEILLLMHESPQRGVLLLPNGAPISSVTLGRIMGIPTPKMVKALDRIAAVGVSDRHPESGALMNRRMVRDEKLRATRAECGRLGGNPNLVKQNSTKEENTDKQNPTPSSSSSISSSSSTSVKPPIPPTKVRKPTAYSMEFEEFWEGSTKRGPKTEAWAQWKRLQGIDKSQAVIAMREWKQSAQWQDETKQPHVFRWLRRAGWTEIVPRSRAPAHDISHTGFQISDEERQAAIERDIQRDLERLQ